MSCLSAPKIDYSDAIYLETCEHDNFTQVIYLI